MAYDDALFQLGMDLTRSSTAQKEDHGLTAQVAHNAVSALGHVSCDSFTPHDSQSRPDEYEENEHGPTGAGGHHLIIDLMGSSRLDDIVHVERTLKRCVEAIGARLLHIHLHHTSPGGGVSGVAVLADSHISIYTRPHAGFAALDLLVTDGREAGAVVPILREAFQAREVMTRLMARGTDAAPAAAVAASISAPQVWRKPAAAATEAPPVRERMRKTA